MNGWRENHESVRETGAALCREARDERGFTLLEVMLALLLIVILMGGIYAIANGSIQLSSEVAQAQNREMLVHSFVQLCKRNIELLPGNAGMTLFAAEDGRFYETEVTFINSPLAFSFAAVPGGYDKVILRSVGDPRGYLRAELVYLNEEEEEEFSGGLDDEVGITLPLLDGVSVFEWRFYDQNLEEWQVEWEDETRRPSFVELTLGFFDGNEPLRTVFWTPPVADPETVIAGFRGGQGRQGGPGGGPGGGRGRGPEAGPGDVPGGGRGGVPGAGPATRGPGQPGASIQRVPRAPRGANR